MSFVEKSCKLFLHGSGECRNNLICMERIGPLESLRYLSTLLGLLKTPHYQVIKNQNTIAPPSLSYLDFSFLTSSSSGSVFSSGISTVHSKSSFGMSFSMSSVLAKSSLRDSFSEKLVSSMSF